ncbi:MAG: hypothetical protein HKM93_23560 [Desulfobacteraceae bacterium]|nr:hypothetical protein [Desulfobacteraceae bacterium]
MVIVPQKILVGIGALGRVLLTLLMVLPVITGCVDFGLNGGGSGDRDDVVTNNLESQDVQIVTSDTQVGHPLKLSVAITAAEGVTDVPVSFYLLNKSEFDAAEDLSDTSASSNSLQRSPTGTDEDPDQFAQHLLCSETCDLETGDNECVIECAVPEGTPPGEYYVIAHVDPSDVIDETDDDNTPDQHQDMDSISGVITVSGEHMNTPDIVLENVILDRSSVLLENEVVDYIPGDPYPPEPSEPAVEDFGATAIIMISGLQDISNIPLTMCLEVPGMGCEPLEIWNSGTSDYEFQHMVDTISPGEPTSVQLGVHIPDDLRALIENEMIGSDDNTLNLKVSIDKDDDIIEHEASMEGEGRDHNNVIVTELAIEIPTDSDPLHILRRDAVGMRSAVTPYSSGAALYFSKEYNKMFESSYFGTGVRFSALASLDTNGAIGHVVGRVPITMFGSTFDFAKFEAYGQATPHAVEDSGFDLDLLFAGQTLYSKSGDAGFSWDKDWSVSKSKGYETLFWLGIVPMIVSAEATGTLGFVVDVSIADDFITSAAPYVSVGSSVTAEISFLLASGGITADMTLISDTFTGDASAGMTLQDSGGDLTLIGTLNEGIYNELEGPTGKVSLWAKYKNGVKWCKSWGVPYPCGLKSHKYSTTIVNWSSFSRTDTILSKTQSTSFPVY